MKFFLIASKKLSFQRGCETSFLASFAVNKSGFVVIDRKFSWCQISKTIFSSTPNTGIQESFFFSGCGTSPTNPVQNREIVINDHPMLIEPQNCVRNSEILCQKVCSHMYCLYINNTTLMSKVTEDSTTQTTLLIIQH